MGLLTKFVLLVSLLCAAVAMNIGATVWSVRFLDRELSKPLASMQSTLERLNEIRTEIQRVEDSLEPHPAEVRAAIEEALRAINALASESQVRVTMGTSTNRNLAQRLRRAAELAEQLEDGGSEVRAELFVLLGETTALIRRIEARVLDESEFAVDFSDRLRSRAMLMNLISSALTLCTIGLSAGFVRRWVLSPIELMRRGTQRFGRGELDHRIRVRGDDQLGQLAADLNTMAETISTLQDERIERERLAAMGEMLRGVVHNLRTPLSGIRGLAEFSRDEAPQDSEIPDMQARIIASVDRFEQWLQELLSVSTPKSVRLKPERVGDWVAALGEARRDAAGVLGVRLRVTIDSDAPEIAEFDSVQLAHAGWVVLDNAIEAAGSGGEVSVRAGGSGGTGWVLEFSDSGPGIPAENLEKIFLPYFSTKPRGTGIGLAMCRAIVQTHGGRVQVGHRESGSRGGSGTVIRFELPRVPGPRSRESDD